MGVRQQYSGGMLQEVVKRACGIYQSLAHQDSDCATAKLREPEKKMNERGVSLRVTRRNLSDDEECEVGYVAGDVIMMLTKMTSSRCPEMSFTRHVGINGEGCWMQWLSILAIFCIES